MRVSRRRVMAGFRPVGALASLRPGIGAAELTAAAQLVAPTGTPTAISSPWAPPSHLESVVWADVFGPSAHRPCTRAEAMRLPEVARARHIICGTIARIPLRAYRGDTALSGSTGANAAPAWLTRTDGPLSPFHRMLWTADDIYFYGWSLWRRTENAADGFPLSMSRVPIGQWELEADTGRVLIYKSDGRGGVSLQPTNSSEVVLIPGPHEGMLLDAAHTIRHAADLHRAANNAARHPSAYLGLKQTTGTPLKRSSDDPAEVTVETVLADWRNARSHPEGGGVAWLGGIEPHEFGTFGEHLLVEGRNAAAVDIARHSSIPADLIDASVAQASLQYSTSRDNDRRAIDYGLGLYMSAISSALSQDAVCPRGTRQAFDLEEWLAGAAPAPGQPATAPAPGLSPANTGETPQ